MQTYTSFKSACEPATLTTKEDTETARQSVLFTPSFRSHVAGKYPDKKQF